MGRLHKELSFALLIGAKAFSRTFYRTRVTWIGEPPEDPWRDVRLAAILNHTSLYEWLWAAIPPTRFLRHLAMNGILPSADKTMRRPMVGTFFNYLAGNVISVTRERDRTWEQVLTSIGERNIVLMAPEGRMKRTTGLDLDGRPMTVRGGIADILRILGEGRMLIAYSGGLHHVQAPGQKLPRLFRTLHMSLESLDIADYRRRLGDGAEPDDFKRAVIVDLERRRDLYC